MLERVLSLRINLAKKKKKRNIASLGISQEGRD